MDENVERHGLSRREFLRRGAVAGGFVLGGGSLLAACGGDEDGGGEAGGGGGADTGGAGTQAATTTETAAPKKGGTLRIGSSGGGSNDQIGVGKATNQTDFLREPQLYEGLYDRDPEYNLVDRLAASTEPNAAGDEWTVQLRDDIVFHDGRPATADDLIASIQLHFKEDYGYTYIKTPFELIGIDPQNGMEKLDDLTVRFTLPKPFALFKDFMTYNILVPADYDVANPIGTGPFKLESFAPGQQSVMLPHTEWWGSDGEFGGGGGPFVEQLLILDFPDNTARVNALLAGQVDAIDALPYGQISVIEGNDQLQVLNTPTGLWRPFTMRVDTPPFDDVRVRQAFRYMVDRDQMLQQAIAGQGIVGNDLYSPQDPFSISGVLHDHPAALEQRTQDIDRAKSLLKEAGQEGLTVEMVTSPVNGGTVEMSEVLVQQAKAAGVTINLRRVDSGTFYGDNYLKWPFAIDWWGVSSYFGQVINADGPTATWNETHFNHPRFNELFRQALAEVDDAKREEIAIEMQTIQWNEGGYIIPYHPNIVDAASATTVGWQPWKTGGSLNGTQLQQISFA